MLQKYVLTGQDVNQIDTVKPFRGEHREPYLSFLPRNLQGNCVCSIVDKNSYLD